jgi:drug/metabolite transporter (DMT)-like permease
VRRAAWLIVATVLACAGLNVSLWAFHHDGEPVVNAVSLALYGLVLLALGGVGYTIHRRAETAVMDAVLAGVVFAPALMLALLLFFTIRDCSSGTGC